MEPADRHSARTASFRHWNSQRLKSRRSTLKRARWRILPVLLRAKPLLRPVYRYLYRHRDAFFPLYSSGSNLAWRAEQSAFVWRCVSDPRFLALPCAGFLIRNLLVAAVMLHMAARENGRVLFTTRLLNVLFRPFILIREPLATRAYVHGLLRCDALDRLMRELRVEEPLLDQAVNKLIGRALLQVNLIEGAEHYLGIAQQQYPDDWENLRLLGRCAALRGHYAQAQEWFMRSVRAYPRSVMAHQNYAARYDRDTYEPQSWELDAAGELLICDTLCQHAEELAIMKGRFLDGAAIYARWLTYQDEIAEGKSLPETLQHALANVSPRFDSRLPTRILPYEWVTQIGHFGSLDAYLKRAILGETPPANHVLLAPQTKVCNQAALGCFEDLVIVVREQTLIDELFPYQRYFGECFRFTRGPNGPEDWTRAASRTQIQWNRETRAPLLKLDMNAYAHEQQTLTQLGIPKGAWYVGLHVREGGFYKEAKGATNDYRNANIGDCFDAIREITARGGYVIRLGDASMQELPPMANVIDYAHSPAKSDQMDIFLFATSRFIIGTTSGLTSMAQAFGTPMLLINCISSDWQFWHDETDFILKRLWSRTEKRYLSIHETFSQPLQGTLIQSHLIDGLDYEPHPNSAREIHEAVRYKLDIMDGTCTRIDASHPLMQAYREEIAHDPFLFGAALPALPFLQNEMDNGRLGKAYIRQKKIS